MERLRRSFKSSRSDTITPLFTLHTFMLSQADTHVFLNYKKNVNICQWGSKSISFFFALCYNLSK